jgi:hypothetical protein
MKMSFFFFSRTLKEKGSIYNSMQRYKTREREKKSNALIVLESSIYSKKEFFISKKPQMT